MLSEGYLCSDVVKVVCFGCSVREDKNQVMERERNDVAVAHTASHSASRQAAGQSGTSVTQASATVRHKSHTA